MGASIFIVSTLKKRIWGKEVIERARRDAGLFVNNMI